MITVVYWWQLSGDEDDEADHENDDEDDEDDEDDYCYKMGPLLETRVPFGSPFHVLGPLFSILDWITQRIAVRTIVESSQNQCKDGRTECPFPPRCGSACENWPPLCNFDGLILCLKFNFNLDSLLF